MYIYLLCNISMGSAYKTHIDKIQTKQNHSARLIFFATAHGEHTESALPLLNLLDVLTVHYVYRFQILKFTYVWHFKKASCQSRFQIILNMPVMYTNTIPGMHRSKTSTSKRCELIWENRQSDRASLKHEMAK